MIFKDATVKPIHSFIPHLALVGCGSVGTYLAVTLCRVAQRITLIDYDTVEPHNNSTHTLSFALIPPDASKSYALKLTIDSLFAPAHVHAVQERGEDIDFSQLDFHRELKYIIIATDSVQSRIAILNNIKQQLQHLPALKAVVDTAISHDGFRITAAKPDELNNLIDLLSDFPERSNDATRACEFVRNISAISALASALLQLLAELEEVGGDENAQNQ